MPETQKCDDHEGMCAVLQEIKSDQEALSDVLEQNNAMLIEISRSISIFLMTSKLEKKLRAMESRLDEDEKIIFQTSWKKWLAKNMDIKFFLMLILGAYLLFGGRIYPL